MPEELPDQSLDKSDAGDNTQNRFRYQAAYAAYLAAQLIGELSPYECIYCELYEDILIKCKSGKFIGVQVKTKEKSKGPFRFGEDEILKSLKRFIKLDIKFPEIFESYVLATNCGFTNSRDGTDLPYAIELLKKNERLDKKGHVFFGKIEALSGLANCSKKEVLSTLNKVNIVDWADLERFPTILAEDIAKLTNNQNEQRPILLKMAEEMMNLTSTAACRSTNLSQPSYYKLLQDPTGTLTSAILENKKISRDMVEKCLMSCKDSVILLRSITPRPISLSPMATKIMELKMSKGGIDIDNILLMKNNNWSAQTLFVEWLHKRGRIEAERHADHISLLVWNECQSVHNNIKTLERLYGQEMLKVVDSKLRDTYNGLKDQYREICYPQILGIAGILTEDCKIWWSERFEIIQAVEV